MKPSEFLKRINADVIGDLSELDKRFIDREEIGGTVDKILHQCTTPEGQNSIIELKKELE